MSDTDRTIFVFGATGQQGGAVARALVERQWPVRALVRDPLSPKAIALRDAGVGLVEGSFDDTDVLRSVMRQSYGVFSVLPGTLPENEEIRLGCSVADVAAESNVGHFIYSSGASVGDKPTGVPRFDAKGRVEAHIRSLPMTATIVRPMIFMEMLARPGFGLNEGRFSFFLQPDQAMQLVAVDDIGTFVAAIFADTQRFGGKTLKLASDTVTGRVLESSLSEAAGRPIAYSRLTDEALGANPSFAAMSASLESGPLSQHADLDEMREINPGIISFRSWLAGRGRQSLTRALGGTS